VTEKERKMTIPEVLRQVLAVITRLRLVMRRMVQSHSQDPELNSRHLKKCNKISPTRGITPIPEEEVEVIVAEEEAAIMIVEATICHLLHKVGEAIEMDVHIQIPQ
jgi:hypothetical protein